MEGTQFCLSACLLMRLHLGGFHLLAAVNYAAVNIDVQGFVWMNILISLEWTPRSRIAELYRNSMFSNQLPDFHSCQKGTRFSPLHTLAYACHCLSFNSSHLNSYEGVSYCASDLHFSES